MWSDDEILEFASERITEFLDSMRFWREREVEENYDMVDNKQWLQDEYDKQINDGFPAFTINQVSPIINSVSGFEIQNRSEVKYLPRTLAQDSEIKAQTAENGGNYIENRSNAEFYDSLSFRDMLICGVGATNGTMSYDHNLNGDYKKWRVFPGFLLWDPAARDKNLRDADWVGEARVTYKNRLNDDFDDEDDFSNNAPVVSFDDTTFLNYYNVVLNKSNLTVVYDFQWRVKEPVWLIPNIFRDEQLLANPLVMAYAQEAEKQYGFNIEEAHFKLNKSNYKKFRTDLAIFGLDIKGVKQKTFRYYRCTIRNGRVYDQHENISQQGFTIKFMTGQYSETDQCFYGLMRAAKDPQRLFNKAISNIQGFIDYSGKGGYLMEADAVSNVKDFIDTVHKGRYVTVVEPGAIGQNKIQQKNSNPPPQGLNDMLGISGKAIMDVMGVNPQWMGLMESKDMTAKLQSQIVRQGLTILSPYFDAKSFYMIETGRLYLDVLRTLAENEPGRIIQKITAGPDESKYMPLLLENIAPEYDIIITDVPASQNERQEQFETLLELAGVLGQKGVDITPLVMNYAPLEKDDLDAVKQLMQPPPPPQPDPLDQALRDSTAKLQYANATKIGAEATSINLDNLNKQVMSADERDKLKVDIDKVVSETQLNEAKRIATLVNP